jgi:DHA2 family multidrug resistance protein
VQAQGAVSGTLLKQSTMLAFSDAFFIMGVLFLVIVPLMFLIKKTPPPRQPVMVE